jgi:hypothetical protein
MLKTLSAFVDICQAVHKFIEALPVQNGLRAADLLAVEI